MRKYLLPFLIILTSSTQIFSQEDSYRPKGVVMITSENDFFLFKRKTDLYYTQGLKVEYLRELPKSSRFSSFWPFLLKSSSQDIIGNGIGQNLFTSSDITIPTVMEGDRPYSAWLYFSTSTISNNEALNRRLTTDLYLGVVGPFALGAEVQRTWHKWINSPDPKGWPNQIKNDMGINFNIKYERGVLSYLSKNNKLAFDFVPNLELQAGSVFNIAAVGTTTRLSLFNASKYFANSFDIPGDIPKFLRMKSPEGRERKKPSLRKNLRLSNLSLFARNSGNLVVWNALLQGGLFNQDSPYLIESNDRKAFYFDLDYGITYSTPYFNITYSRAFRTKEFDQQNSNHQWGQIHVVLKL